jgi:hypothetical protein
MRRRPDQVIEFKISLQDTERAMLETVTTAYLLGNIGEALQGLGVPEIVKQFKDPTEMVGIFYSIAMLLEFMGFETGLPTPADFETWFQEYQSKSEQMAEKRKEAGGSTSVWGQFLDTFRTLAGVDPSKRWE